MLHVAHLLVGWPLQATDGLYRTPSNMCYGDTLQHTSDYVDTLQHMLHAAHLLLRWPLQATCYMYVTRSTSDGPYRTPSNMWYLDTLQHTRLPQVFVTQGCFGG